MIKLDISTLVNCLKTIGALPVQKYTYGHHGTADWNRLQETKALEIGRTTVLIIAGIACAMAGLSV